MRRMKLWLRLSIIFLVLFVIMIASSLHSISRYNTLQLTLRKFYDHPYSVSNAARSIMNRLDEIHHREWILLLNAKHADREEFKESLEYAHSRIITRFDELRARYLGDIEDIESAYREYIGWKEYLEAYMGKFLPGSKIEIDDGYHIEERLLLERTRRKMRDILNFANTKADELYTVGEKQLAKGLQGEFLFLLIEFLLMLIVTYLLLRSILKPLEEIVQVAKKIESKDYSQQCDERFGDEIGILGKTLNKMAGGLIEFNHKLEQKVMLRTKELENEMEKRNRIQQQIEESESLFRGIFESNLFGVVIWGADGKLMRINDKFLSMLGYERAEIDNHDIDWSEFITAGQKNTILAEITEEWGSKKEISPFETEVICRDGSYKEVQVRVEVLHERPVMGFSIIQDITERKANERELEEYRKNLEKRVEERTEELQQKVELADSSHRALTYLMDDMNDSRNEILHVNRQLDSLNKELEAFSYSISHDLKAPLRAIDGFSLAIEEDYLDKLDEEGREYIKLIRGNAQKMAALINDLLEFSRLGRKEINQTKIDMGELVKDVFSELKIIEKGRIINLEVGELQPAYGDRTMLKQVLINLISNSLKFTRTRETAEIKICSKISSHNNEIEYCVSDNGVGFDMKYYDKLFGVFQRLHTDEVFEGTGVGLALSKRIVAKHGGRIWAESKIDKGAKFCFSIPPEQVQKNIMDDTWEANRKGANDEI